MFREAVVDTWKQRQAEAVTPRQKLERRAAELGDYKSKLVDAHLRDKLMDRETYESKIDELNEQATVVELELHEARLDLLDVEGGLAFGEHFLLNAAGLRCSPVRSRLALASPATASRRSRGL